jgi:tRNA 2-selenouridine synthase
MTSLLPVEEALSFIREGRAMLDVRAPVEFASGAVPGAVNEPILTDEEREKVGLCYKQEGPQAATALGHALVSGDRREERIRRWRTFFAQHPDSALYCFRGGQRSAIAQQWLAESGLQVPRVAGGYKAMRRALMHVVDKAAREDPFLVIGGRTGSAKTRVIRAIPEALDLEGAARHRGSAFGRMPAEQPCQVDFEHRLAQQILQRQHPTPPSWWVVEDESRLIGRCFVPQSVQDAMKQAPMVLIEVSLPERVAEVYQSYVVELSRAYGDHYGAEHGWSAYRQSMLEALGRIRKRLGDVRFQQLEAEMGHALARPEHALEPDRHTAWITTLLTGYYDRMYDYQLQQKARRIVFRGPREAVRDFVAGALTTGRLPRD